MNRDKKRRFGRIIMIAFPKRLFYPAFAVWTNFPFPIGNGRVTGVRPLTSSEGMSSNLHRPIPI
jgi:hypothetical protein